MSMTETPRSERLHIGIFGNRNAGKSSLINALTGQNVSVVSDVAGTTTDPVYKAMELHGFGPVVFIDTPGLDDTGKLGELRVKKTMEALEKTDVVVFVFEPSALSKENALSSKTGVSPTVAKVTEEWLARIKAKNIPIIPVVNKCDDLSHSADSGTDASCDDSCDISISGGEMPADLGTPLPVSAKNGTNIEKLRELIIRRVKVRYAQDPDTAVLMLDNNYQASIRSSPESFLETSITGNLVQNGDLVLLVMPQDIEAPKGRLILPQVQTIRELLDKKCSVMSCTADTLDATLKCLAMPPSLIITDSQAFKTVYPKVPEGSRLTSFSILFAAYKGDMNAFLSGAQALANLKDGDRVLVAEACTHPPTNEDIGREKIPSLIRTKIGENVQFDFVRGADFPDDLSQYQLIIHCGACMFNRQHVMSRIARAASQNVPICNYGIALAYLTGILDKVVHP